MKKLTLSVTGRFNACYILLALVRIINEKTK